MKLKPFTVIGRYPNGKTVVVHVETTKATEARRCAVQRIAIEVYDGRVAPGLEPMNEAIRAIAKDFSLVAVLDGWLKPKSSARTYLAHLIQEQP